MNIVEGEIVVIYKRELENGRELEFSYRDVDHDRLMIFLPGISGNAGSERFRYMEEVAVHSGYSLVRMDFQFQQYKDESLTIRDCIMDVLAVVEYLKRRDINAAKDIVIVAKSFGALVYHLLEDNGLKVSRAILLAPYVRIKESSMDFLDIPIRDLKEEMMFMQKALLKDIPTFIFHGLKDTVIDIENSENLVKLKDNYILEQVNTDHKFDEQETHSIIIKKTAKFLAG